MKKHIIAASLLATGLAIAAPVNAQSASRGDESIRPYKIHIPDAELADLKHRITATRWPDSELVKDETQGVQLATMKALAGYWATKYDWRKVESRLNALPQFVTNIDGVDIHFIHVRSKYPNALPVIITHGWPGSVIEQLKIVGPLTDPVKYGGKAEDAFDVVIPSIPGHGFSGKPAELGWNPVRVAKAWITLMDRLGYKQYVAQGGDWGNAISENMALIAPAALLGIHTNMAATVPADISKALASGNKPAGLSADEQIAYGQLDFFYKKGLGYASEMSLRPQTLYAVDDSPVGLAAWMLDHDDRSYKLITRVFAGEEEGLTRDDILDNITLYWLTRTGISSARLYWEASQGATGGFFDPRGLKIPVAVSAFPDEIYAVPRTWAERAYPRLIYFNKLEKGGHFAAWEQPEAFTKELRAAFQSLRVK
ncbi:Pimeloyl-ACP methyl ester carboxylesterase [Dyadobacter sp. SG02]|uniref:epoxide hydrolase family protein n=1 Tax=Dyadobacter sp. SG02 TaxID=1855291 RepID=UPI0008C8B38C|nr:epoxide hydrolase family protein [Dyadobacter sp. SG02]SEI54758.1 Pimeloyl-ACP methyl ester carboxylesterase [Dyadobacter sp. SG02]